MVSLKSSSEMFPLWNLMIHTLTSVCLSLLGRLTYSCSVVFQVDECMAQCTLQLD
jgi:hypothetical protein